MIYTMIRATAITTIFSVISLNAVAQSGNVGGGAKPTGTQVTAMPTLASLHSSNPTAVPLTAIRSSVTTQPTVAIAQPATPGASPPVSGAPPLPTFAYSPSEGYPALDVVPPINSTQVQGWIKEVQNSGIAIPNIAKSVDGSCGSDPAKAANATNCWWTCGGCTRNTDIVSCPDKNTWGVSYDDGPSPYSTNLLNYLNANQLKSTFFIVGSRAISRPDILQAEYMSGHQLSVHTWSHPYLTTLSNEQIIAELGWTKYALKQITGVTPNTMRPPYGDIDDRVRAICKAMGLTPIMWSNNNGNYFDTEDWHIPAGQSVISVVDNFNNILNNASSLPGGFIVLAHDLYQQTVDLAIGYVLPDALARKTISLKSIIDCLHKPLSDAYIETNNNQSNSNPAATGTNGGGSSTRSGGSQPTQGGQSGQSGGAALQMAVGLDGLLITTGMILVGAFVLF